MKEDLYLSTFIILIGLQMDEGVPLRVVPYA